MSRTEKVKATILFVLALFSIAHYSHDFIIGLIGATTLFNAYLLMELTM